MDNKSKTLSIRINKEIYQLLSNNSKNNNMSVSDYVRSILEGVTPNDKNYNPQIVSLLSRLYIRLSELGISEEEIAKEVYALCQILS